jgi:hypothetical protein
MIVKRDLLKFASIESEPQEQSSRKMPPPARQLVEELMANGMGIQV